MFDEPLKILRLMRNFNSNWFVAGGWAIDLYVGKETRHHEDIEIAIFRKDQTALQNYLDGWVLQKAVNKTLSEWKSGEILELPVHEIHCFKQFDEKFVFEVLLNEIDGEEWLFRRNDKVKLPLSRLSLMSNLGMKFLCPEIVLLYKSKNPRPKDEQDFEIVRKRLDTESKEWLKKALSICYSEHGWLQKL